MFFTVALNFVYYALFFYIYLCVSLFVVAVDGAGVFQHSCKRNLLTKTFFYLPFQPFPSRSRKKREN